MSEKKIEKGLVALRKALDVTDDDASRKSLLELIDMLALHKGAIGAIVEAGEMAKKTRAYNLHVNITDEAAAALAAAKRALMLSGIDKLLTAIADDAAIDSVGTDGSMQVASSSKPAAIVGAAAGLEAQLRALPIGIMTTPAGERSVAILREAQRRIAETPPEPIIEAGDEFDFAPPPYEPPEMTDQIAAAVARDVARIMVLGDEVVTGGTSELRDMRFAIRSALWEHGYMTEEHQNRESFRRRLYRSGKANQNDPALLAFEDEMARLRAGKK